MLHLNFQRRINNYNDILTTDFVKRYLSKCRLDIPEMNQFGLKLDCFEIVAILWDKPDDVVLLCK